MKERLVEKNLIAFNSPFEQTQLAHSGYSVWKNSWIDVALMARAYDNRLAEERIFSLADMETALLGTSTKKEFVEKLVAKYGKKYFHHPSIEKDPLFQEYGINDTRLNWALYNHLKDKMSSRVFYKLQELQDKLTAGALKGIPFPRVRLKNTLDQLLSMKQVGQRQQVDIRAGTKSKASLMGWSSSKLKTAYIKKYKTEGGEHLELTKSGMVKFDNAAKDKLFKLFPNDKVLELAYRISKTERAIQHLKKLLEYAEGDKLYPNYMMLGTSTGRFTATKPEFHNLNRKPPILAEKEIKELYNVRDLLLGRLL